MNKRADLKCLGIILFLSLGMILFSFQACKTESPSVDEPTSLGIASDDFNALCSPDGTKIAFCNDRYGNSDIYTMDTDGANIIRLTDNPSSDRNPSWSRDSQKITFSSNREGNGEIYIMNVDGSNQTRLTHNPAQDRAPAWSPDGSKIMFVSDRDGNLEIYVMNTDGSDQTRLTNNPAPDMSPAWSPDGSRIIFISIQDRNMDIYSIKADGSDRTRLTDNPSRERDPAWSPDGSRIVFDTNRDGNREIYIMNADGSEQTNLTNHPAGDKDPSWSHDGKKILFYSERDHDEEVYMIDTDGSNPVNLTKNAAVNEASGSAPVPPSEMNLEEIPYKIVYESWRDTEGKENAEICLIDADGSNFVNLTNTPEIDEQFPHASPDGSRICFIADEGEDRMSRSRNLYYMNIDGSDRIKVADNAYQACWSPDGRFIAYLPGEFPRYNPRSRANKGLKIYELETGEVKIHPNDEIRHLQCLCWSPDGEWFTATPGVLFGVDNKTFKSLTMTGCTPDISPDGKFLVWNSTPGKSLNIGTLNYDALLNNLTDHRMKVACGYEYWIDDADWSPDGKYLAFMYGFDDEGKPADERKPWMHISVCDLKTGKWTQITTEGKFNENPDWIPVKAR
jgi:Tol biopolymer transport system component